MHFTYAGVKDVANLHQGDVLRRTPELVSILEAVHKHYANEQYRFFQVVTQSCDLMRRDGMTCSSPYITIAASRPVAVALGRYAKTLQFHAIEKRLDFCSKERQPKLKQFLERLLNNNEESYFYLHSEPDSGLHDDHCTFLQLSVPLKADLHYETLLGAKILQLEEPFEHKLGWLVGSAYSRVGTQDFAKGSPGYDEIFDRHIQAVLMNWLERDEHTAVMNGLKRLPELEQTEEKLLELSQQALSAKALRKEEALKIIAEMARGAGAQDEIVDRMVKRLRNNSEFKAAMKL